MDNHNSQFGSDVQYTSLDYGTPAWAVKPGPGAIAPIPAVPGAITVSENFESTLWLQISFGGGDWTLTTAESHSPTHSFRSKVIADNQTSTFTVYNDTFDPQISFWAKTNTEAGFDKLRIKIDGVEVYSESGLNDWHYVSIPMNFGYQVDFIYSKDFSSSPVGDGVWVDDIGFGALDTPMVPGSPAHPWVYAPFHLTSNNELIITTLGAALSVTGNVSIINIPHVIVDSMPAITIAPLTFATDKVDVSGSSITVSGEVEIKNDVGNPIPVTGSVTVSDGSGPLTVDGTVAATQSGAWTTGRTWDLNFATDQVDASGSTITVNQGTSPWVVSGIVNIGTIPEIEIKNDSGNPVPVSGTVAVTQSTSPWVVSGTVNIGTIPEVEIKNDSGNPVPVSGTITVNQGTSPWVTDVTDRAARQVGLVDIRKASTVSTPAQTSTSSSAAVVLSSNASRRSFIIQNTGTVPVKLTFDGTNPTQTAYHLCLSACTVADDGTGAIYMDDQWTGDIRAISASAGTIVITEVT